MLPVFVVAGIGSPQDRAQTRQAPPPRPGVAVNIEPTSGRTFYREPGQARPSRLAAEIQVPVNTTVDATNGRMGLTSAYGIADFYGGVFVIRESVKEHVTQLFLAREHFGACARRSKRVLQRLWGDGKGRFRTRGRYAAASVRGTKWLVQDRCDGTLTTVSRGLVAVRDFRLRRTVFVRAGHGYFARR